MRVQFGSEQAYVETNTNTYTPETGQNLVDSFIGQSQAKPILFEVSTESFMAAVRRLIKASDKEVLCLNFASGKNAGGGFLNGSLAQEESIALTTGLYPCQIQKGDVGV